MDALSIQLSVYRERSDTPDVIYLEPEQYFDLDPGEVPDVDSVPLYSNLEQYLDEIEKATKLALKIENVSVGKSLYIEKVYQNQQRSTVTTRSEYQHEALTYREIIYESMLPMELITKGRAYDLCRFVVDGDTAECIYHGIFYYTPDGKETEYRII